MTGTHIYYLGGSPCSGKSTAARALREKYGLRGFDLDAHLEEYTCRGALDGNATLLAAFRTPPGDMWMLPPAKQCAQEMEIYRAMLPYALKDIAAMGADAPVLAEGAGFLPCLMRDMGVAHDHYACLTPARGFQISRYRQRTWTGEVLASCHDAGKAFDNWMARDCLFAAAARRQAKELGYFALRTDEKSTPEATLRALARAYRYFREQTT